MSKPTVLYAVKRDWFGRIFTAEAQARMARRCAVLPAPIPVAPDKAFLLAHAGAAEILITGWDTAALDAEVVAAAPNLKLVVHSAGSVKNLVSDAMWDRGIRITSAAPMLAIGVAEFCLGLMLTASKRVDWLANRIRQGGWRDPLTAHGEAFEIYGQNVGIIAASAVGRNLIRLLKPFGCRIQLFDPYCSAAQAKALGVTKVDTLDAIFSACRVVSLNAPVTDETTAMIRGRHFALLPEGAVFINTARGVLIDEPEMIAELRKGRFVACLDVTHPEPPAADSALRTLPNVLLTPHIAGAIASNLTRQGNFVNEEIRAYLGGIPLKGEVSQQKLKQMA